MGNILNGQLVLEFRGMSARDSKKNSKAFTDGIEAYFKWRQIREFWKKADYEVAVSYTHLTLPTTPYV